MFIVLNQGCPHVARELAPYCPNRLAAICQTWRHSLAFDKVSRYEARPDETPDFTALQRILAYTIYNPSTNIEVMWHAAGPCRLADIVAEVERGLEKDDDIIQQWFGGDDVLKLLRSATTFEEMCDRVECISGGCEVYPHLNELAVSVLGRDAVPEVILPQPED